MLFKKQKEGKDVYSILNKKKKRLIDEQQKLEKMVADLFEKGDHNMGQDVKILKQSDKLDRLIVDEMLLREIDKKYNK